ncbi:hypothetical protein [Polyangium sp. 6x1]|uniref:MSCRAMM family protein n=1 Tax=Polyangium sp. 6x1 TaxID=3042689 RepID=UPI0024826AF6|nr:hypothetical protein [Polyangium sp. 6x1]MDI1450428.1 hypothetical protein [Polyangium sp. 6x1]
MSAETTGFGNLLLGRPRRLDRHGILAFLRNVALDRRGMLELRRLLAEELHRSSIHNLRDEVVIEQLADRYVRGSLSLVLVRPREVELEGFFIEGADTTPLTGPKNEAGDLRPAPEVPPEYPVLARVESDQIIDSTLKLVARLADLLFGSFGLQKRPSTLAQELVLLAADEARGVKGAGTKVDLELELELHPQGGVILPDPQIKDAYVAAAAEIAAGPHPAAKGLIDLIFPLARVDVTRRFDNPVKSGSVRNDRMGEDKAEDGSGDWVEIELVDDGDPPKPLANQPFRVELRNGKVVEGVLDENGKARVEGVTAGSATVTFPEIDKKKWKANDEGKAYGLGGPAKAGASPVTGSSVAEDTTFVEVELLDDGDPPKPVAGARYRVELDSGETFEGTLDDRGKARLEGLPKGKGTITFPDIDQGQWEPNEGGSFTPPSAGASAASAPSPAAAGAWTEIELVDDADPPKPVAGARYRLELADGKVIEGTLDENGKARIDDVPEGSGTLTFPDIDEGHWR